MAKHDNFVAYCTQYPEATVLIDEAQAGVKKLETGLPGGAQPDATILVAVRWAVSQAEERLGGVSPRTVRAWLSQGRIQRANTSSRPMVERTLNRLCASARDAGKRMDAKPAVGDAEQGGYRND